jgi:hypothetical protein
MTLIDIAQLLQESSFGTALRESQYAFPIVEGVHLLGLAASFGLILLTDLRLIGVFLRHVPVADVLHQLRYWIFSGFVVTFVSGGLLFWAEAATLIVNTAFLWKVGFMLLACLNAAIFEFTWGRRVSQWAGLAVLPAGTRFAGWASLGLWTLATIFGRYIPYSAS